MDAKDAAQDATINNNYTTLSTKIDNNVTNLQNQVNTTVAKLKHVNVQDDSVAIGNGSQVTGVDSIAIGTGHRVSGNHSGAFGDPNVVSGNGSYAFGNDNTIIQDNTFVLGNNVATTQANSVVLGNNSADRAATSVVNTSIGGATTANFAGTTPTGIVSIGAANAERQLINVAAGDLSATSTDAVNGSQLFQVGQTLAAADAKLQSNIDQNKADADAKDKATNDRVTTEVTRLDDKNTQQDRIIESHTNTITTIFGNNGNTTATGTTTLGQGANNGNTQGSTIVGNNASATKDNSTVIGNSATSNGTGGIAIGKNAVANNDGAIAVGHNSQVNGMDSVALGHNATSDAKNSVALGANSINDRDNTVSVGSKGNERQVTYVADGINAFDAVNVRQMQREVARLDAMDHLQNQVIMRHEQQLDMMGYKVEKLETNMSRGIAGAVALSSIPAAQTGKHALGFGSGFFNGESSVSLGYTGSLETSDKNIVSIKAGMAFAPGGNNTFGLGATYNFN